MKGLIRKAASLLVIFALFAGVVPGLNVCSSHATGETMFDYSKLPAFLETGLNPNLLLLIDNSASMYDPAYVDTEDGSKYCYADADATHTTTDSDGNTITVLNYDNTKAYAGYFSPLANVWYKYDNPSVCSDRTYVNQTDCEANSETWSATPYRFIEQTESEAEAFCNTTSSTDTEYNTTGSSGSNELCVSVNEISDPNVVTAFAAHGRFLNWLTSSKFDIEKEILTGGKYNESKGELILETRGCQEKRFIKEVAVKQQGDTTTTYSATFGVRPPTDDEISVDVDTDGYTSISNTRIEIYQVTTGGFDPSNCQLAIDEFLTGGNLGTISNRTGDCLGTNTPSATSFNHIMQECWYYNSNGDWQPGAGTVSSLKNDCESVYRAHSGDAPPPADYENPADLFAGEICQGQYDPDHPTDGTSWGSGYVGQCWEEDYSVPMIAKDCTDLPAAAISRATAIQDSNNFWSYCNVDKYTRCGKKNLTACSKDSDWSVWYVPGAGTPLPTKVFWTDDDSDSNGTDETYECVDLALKEYCGNVDQPTMVDPTDEFAGSVSGAAIPSVLVDYAAVAQLGEPLSVLKGRISQSTAPVGLVHEFKYNLRIGAMVFNDGSASECAVKQDSSGKYVATLYDCLVDKGADIHGPLLPTIGGSVPDSTKLDGGRIISYIDEGSSHTASLTQALNNVNATTWTPTSEAMYSAIGYFTQDSTNDLRINASDFIRDSDESLTLGSQDKGTWSPTGTYTVGDIVRTVDYKMNYGISPKTVKLYRAKNSGTSALCSDCSYIEEDSRVKWMPYDPVLAGCQSNNILLVTDGASTADIESGMVSFIGDYDGDTAYTWTDQGTSPPQEPTKYECKDWIDDGDSVYEDGETIVAKNFGSTLLDDLTAYGHSSASIYSYSTINEVNKQPLNTHVVVAGTLRDDGSSNECNAKTILNAAANNGQDADGTDKLVQAADPAELESALRSVFEAIGGEVSSGSAASVIAHSRSGEGAIYQAIFYPKQVDVADREVDWTGDVHSLWLDSGGNIREDCGGTVVDSHTDCPASGDHVLDLKNDYIIEFYTDATGSAKVRRFWDDDGDNNLDKSGTCSNGSDSTGPECRDNEATWTYAAASDFVADNIMLKDLHYIWSGADWLAGASGVSQRAYDSTAKERYIFTMLPDGSGNPDLVDFTTDASTGLPSALTANEYNGYFNAVTSADPSLHRTADGIVNYIRGVDQADYRSRELDWTEAAGTETVKLGDIIHSTPTLVSSPAENFDVVYGDPTYRTFRKKYQYRRSVVYAGANDGGLHAFNGGYYDRHSKQFLTAPPDFPLSDPFTYTKTQYDLGAELWMYVPKNIFPHLRWLTDQNYGDGHVYYIDTKPYIFDAKIFSFDSTDPDEIHPGGWGTILVGGMRFGGGDIGVNIDADAGDDETMRSAYFILDITNPEYPPVVLAEFTADELGFTTGSPTAIPMLRCDKNSVSGLDDCNDDDWPMDWYLAFGSGPHNDDPVPAGPQAGMQGLSDQTGRIYVMKLGGVGTAVDGPGTTIDGPASLGNVGTGQVTTGVPTFANRPSLAAGYPLIPGVCSDFNLADEATCLTAGEVWNPVSCQEIPGVWDTLLTYSDCTATGRYWDLWWGNNGGAGCYERLSPEDCLASGGSWPKGNNNLGVCSSSLETSQTECLDYSGSWRDTYANSFFADFITVDYDLSFQAETLYFGSVYGTQALGGHDAHVGAVHRLVINDDPDPATWTFNTFYDAQSPVTAAPSVATDGERAWVYFGTGRYISAKEDKALEHPDYATQFLGLKESYDSSGDMNLYATNGGMLVDVTDVGVLVGGNLIDVDGDLVSVDGENLEASNVHTGASRELINPDATSSYVSTFAQLNIEMSEQSSDLDVYHGWKIELGAGERVIGQPAILGDVVTFTSYIPSNDPCIPEGDSYLWASYFRTGTSYYKSVIGTRDNGGNEEVLRKVSLGKGLSTTPNIHTGAGDGTKAFVQSSTGAILSIEQTNPGVVKSGMRSWRELSN